MKQRLTIVALLVVGSGFCALLYQTVWLREFRLIFGASTSASAAVIAIFMGGLGCGGLFIGRRVERSADPLGVYGSLEVAVAISAGLSPLLFWIVRAAYLTTGGSFRLGVILVTIVRLIGAVIIIGVPATLMGGTLPAASRAVESEGDERRRGVAILYAINTLGAVAGAALSTFILLERLGNLRTLICAALLNAFVGLSALLVSRQIRAGEGGGAPLGEIAAGEDGDVSDPVVAPRLVFGGAAIVGFAFLLMELVWYRILTPLLGGTTFTFGLILAAALAGIGLGSFFYSVGRPRRPDAAAFALTCAAEGLLIALPFAIGDHMAVLALLLRDVGLAGFGGYVFGWVLIAIIVVFAPACAAGYQFPLLISLLGKGRRGVANDVGRAYAWNTLGAIAGSLAGGFGILPLLTAPGAWRLAAALLAAVAVVAAVQRPVRRIGATFAAIAVAVVTGGLLFAAGPTAFWRHSPIGAGRVATKELTPNRIRDLESSRRRQTIWEADGVESSVAVADDEGYAFIVNGKGDGHARMDAGTQVMSGVLAGLLHPAPQHAVVIGLGTGTTAGWLGSLPSIESVDAVEIEPSIVHVAAMCSAVNRDVLHNPKVRVRIGDGREFLLAGGRTYDVISSEPSNPYRAGIASLFTTEFYRAAADHLAPGGIFIQFLQAYEVDAGTIRMAYATITGVFPHVETWQSQSGDLLLVGSRTPLVYDRATIAQRMAAPVIGEGLWRVWWASDPESVLAHYVCGNATARDLGATASKNTDDRTRIEYAFARTLGRADSFRASELRDYARARGDDVPVGVREPAAVAAIERRRMSLGVADNSLIDLGNSLPFDLRLRGAAQNAYVHADYGRSWELWQALRNVESPLESLAVAEALANRGDEKAWPYIESLHSIAPVESAAVLARLRWRQGRVSEAVDALTYAFGEYRKNPWPLPTAIRRALTIVVEMADVPNARPFLPRLVDALSEPFAIHLFDDYRRSAQLLLADRISGEDGCSAGEMSLVASYEPNVPWQHDFLRKRAICYRQYRDARAARAEKEWATFEANEPQRLNGPPGTLPEP
ncbi:MAG TPA: spermidine synthase [Thermoanaerobaculia bacterium]|jgi:spermidine synthase|nr:spermidine synthase [Thermoanaerobaculia bacterium]